MTSLNPVHTIGQQLVEAVQLHQDVSKKVARARGARAPEGGRDPARRAAHRRLPAPVLGRHAPARDDRDGARQRPRPADRRRADDRARRDDAGADPEPDRQAPGRLRQRGDHDHPRPRRRSPRSPTTWSSCTRPRSSSRRRSTTSSSGRAHPYTWGLLGSLPRLDADVERLVQIQGSPPSLLNPPRGCRFHPRCPYVMDVCKTQDPALAPVAGRARAHDGVLARPGDEGPRGREAARRHDGRGS